MPIQKDKQNENLKCLQRQFYGLNCVPSPKDIPFISLCDIFGNRVFIKVLKLHSWILSTFKKCFSLSSIITLSITLLEYLKLPLL